jgi:hypothetical protein
MNNIQLSKEQLISSLKLAPNWEVRDANFGTVLASSENGMTLSDAIEDLQEKYSGYNLIIKAGKKDQNGKFGNGTKTLAFTLPAQNSENEIEIIQLQNQNQNQTQGLSGFGLFGTPKQGTAANFQELMFSEKIKSLEGLFSVQVEKIQSESKTLIGEIENKYRAQLLDMREAQITQKENELYERERKIEDDENERVNSILPKGKNLLSGILDMFLKDKPLRGLDEKKEVVDKKEPEQTDIDDDDVRDVNPEEEKQVDVLIGKLSNEQKEILLEKLSDEFDNEHEENTENTENNENPIITE